MRNSVFLRKQSRIILALADALSISEERALDLFYSSETCRQLSNPKCGLHLMSDGYVLENILSELREGSSPLGGQAWETDTTIRRNLFKVALFNSE